MSHDNAHVTAPVFRRLWFVILSTCLLITMPVALVILLTGPVYKRIPDGYAPIGRGAHRLYAGFLVLWVVLATLRILLLPGGFTQEWASSADPDLPKPGSPQVASTQQPGHADGSKASRATSIGSNGLPACDSQEATDAVKGAIEESGTSKLVTITVEDYGKASETVFDKQQNARHCAAEAVLNTGATHVTFQIFLGPSGKQIVQAQTGDLAELQLAADEQMKEDQQRTALNDVGRTASGNENGATLRPTENDAAVRDQYSTEYLTCASNSQPIQEHAADMVKCINAEIDVQNLRFKQKFEAKMSSLATDDGLTYRSTELAWADRMASNCKAKPNASGAVDPVAEPHCVLNATIRHLRAM